LDFVGEIHPSSSKGHRFMLIATDYFTKWTEVLPLRNMTHREVIRFLEEHIIHKFGRPQPIMTNQGASVMSHQLLNSLPYYAQANGQAESSNKVLLKLINKKVDEYTRRWHQVLSKALWAQRTWRHGTTKVTPFEPVYDQEAMLPVGINLQTCRVTKQETLSATEYTESMMDRINDILDGQFRALRE
jgi:hypothetical protein